MTIELSSSTQVYQRLVKLGFPKLTGQSRIQIVLESGDRPARLVKIVSTFGQQEKVEQVWFKGDRTGFPLKSGTVFNLIKEPLGLQNLPVTKVVISLEADKIAEVTVTYGIAENSLDALAGLVLY